MTIVGETGTAGTAAIKTDYPIEEGLELGTTKIDGRQINLVAEDSSKVLSYDKVGL